MLISRKIIFIGTLVIGILLIAAIAHSQTWIEDSFEDFADGTFDASGQNIFVSRDGKVRTINR